MNKKIETKPIIAEGILYKPKTDNSEMMKDISNGILKAETIEKKNTMALQPSNSTATSVANVREDEQVIDKKERVEKNSSSGNIKVQFTKSRRVAPTEGMQKTIFRIIESYKKKGDSRYSVLGSDELEARIAGQMALIKKFIVSRIGIKNNLAIVLGGSYGRGEGGVVKIGIYERPFNDYDFFVFVRHKSYVGKKMLHKKFNRAAKALTKELGIVIDFSPPYDKDMLPGFPTALRWYDLKFGHRVILGDPDVLRALPTMPGKALPIQEAIQLIMNRGVDLLQAKILLKRQEINPIKILMLIYKCFLALGDAFLIAKGTYHYDLQVRKEILELYGRSIQLAGKIYPYYCEAIEFKTRPKTDMNEAKIERIYVCAETAFKTMYLQLFALYYDKPLKTYKGFPSVVRKKPVVDFRGDSKLKNVLLNISCFGLSSLQTAWGLSYPANRLYAALPFFLFNEVRELYSVKEIDEILCWRSNEAKPISLKKKYRMFLSIWSRFN